MFMAIGNSANNSGVIEFTPDDLVNVFIRPNQENPILFYSNRLHTKRLRLNR